MPALSYLVPVGLSLLGGLMGSEEKTVGKTNPTSQTTVSSGGSSTQHRLDPRMEQAIYGAGGIMPNASAWYAQNSSGLNPQMVQGLNNQWNQLGASAQGFNQMQNLGMGLMGGGTAGNPFTGGGGIAPQNLSYTPAQQAPQTTSPFTMPAPTAPAPAMTGGGYGGGGGGGGYTGYRPADWSNPTMDVPTTSTAGYGGYGGYSTLPAYSYPGNGGGGE